MNWLEFFRWNVVSKQFMVVPYDSDNGLVVFFTRMAPSRIGPATECARGLNFGQCRAVSPVLRAVNFGHVSRCVDSFALAKKV